MSLDSVSEENPQTGGSPALTPVGANPSGGETQKARAEAFAKKHLRWNFVSLMTDYGLFGLGMTFASISTILPAFAERLGASNLMIGMIPAAMTLGFTLPPLFAANFTERLERKLPLVLTYTAGERVPLLILAIAAYFLAIPYPSLTIAVLLFVLLFTAGVGGALTPAWMDLIGKVIPVNYRGRLFAYGSTIAAGLGLAGAALAGVILETYPFPLNYAICFAVGFVLLMISFIFLAIVREPPLASTKPIMPFSQYIKKIPAILKSNKSFSWYLVFRGTGNFASVANGFYTVFALREFGAQDYQVALFTFILLAGQTVANLGLGVIADRMGHKPVLLLGTLSLVLGNALAIFAGSLEVVFVVFIFMSIWVAAWNVSALNFSLEFAPPSEGPTYIGMSTSLVAPVAFIAPLIGGFLADSAGYRVVFAFSGVAAVIGAFVISTRVIDPRRLKGHQAASPSE